jgi:hypothetical protein
MGSYNGPVHEGGLLISGHCGACCGVTLGVGAVSFSLFPGLTKSVVRLNSLAPFSAGYSEEGGLTD